ncbi:TraM recognition domain-containing protein [Patescibacteria group bacterium]|nr:TraM recognition domain-containing protein [Patescibacteria group bacterium]
MALESPVHSIATPEDELAYLRAQVESKEQELRSLKQEQPRSLVAHERIIHHRQNAAEVLAPSYQLPEHQAQELALNLDPENDDETMDELRNIMQEKGIRNAFAVLEKLNSPHLEDDFHRFLVQYLIAGMPLRGLAENQPAWKALHLTLYEIALPESSGVDQEGRTKTLKEMISAMEQFYSGMLSVSEAYTGEPAYFALELAVPVDRSHLLFYASVPNSRRDLFEKQILAIFPHAHITPQPNDYNIFVADGYSMGSTAKLTHPTPLPLKDYNDFDYDPLNSVLNAFAKIQADGEGAALQIIIEPRGDRYVRHYRRVLEALREGQQTAKALTMPESLAGEFFREAGSLIVKQKELHREHADQSIIESVEKKMASSVVATNIRLVVSSQSATRATQILGELEASFNQFENTRGNRITFKRMQKGGARELFHNFSFRLLSHASEMPLSLRELTTMYHFPPKGIESSPHLKQSRFTASAAPLNLPKNGMLLGTNTFRGMETPVTLAPADRLRHLYVIGQTGTGKSVFLKNLCIQDIRNGEGTCFIDPHGNDIIDILAAVPPERYEDVIYFDPAYLNRPLGLNLLEYDPSHPEQKTFIVNEILAIFRRLYGDTPESMGPAFEQYFRNATLLVMEDPASGSTMLDIARVLSNSEFRNMKLSRSMNPIVNQFWQEIATKAEGEASLQNIVPYITNKFDDFTANDFMRPIIGQQQSSFNFRNIIDTKKILLVNLSKGRLGERNANLLGLILVGKLFMAALSRADSPGKDFPPFYLYIDEFQNITTDSIPSILSEARKYKLSLTVAHQFLAQIDERIRDAVFGNVGSMAIFRVGQEDGEFFEKQFAPVFTALDFVNIENYNAYLRILADGVPQKPFNIKTTAPLRGTPDQVDDLRELSYLTYGRDRSTVENSIRARYMS